MHGNDTAVELGSHHDRHALPGEGNLGEEFYRMILRMEQLDGTPLVVEIPPGPGDRNVVRTLRRLRRWSHPKAGGSRPRT